MKICGIDYSVTSPGVVKAELDDNFNFIDIKYLGFSSVKKTCKTDDNLIFCKKEMFDNDIERYRFIRDNISNFLYSDGHIEYGAIEGYAYGSSGKVFNIAEGTIFVKKLMYDNNTKFKIYEPNTIKMFSTNDGNAGKVTMHDKFVSLKDHLLILDHLEEYKNPKEDLIDAYFIMRLLQAELKLRYGFDELRNYSLKQIQAFNKVTKSNPVNILAQDFIEKR